MVGLAKKRSQPAPSSEGTEFGQSGFGPLDLTNFGQSIWMCVCGVSWWGPPKIPRFFPLLPPFSLFLSSLVIFGPTQNFAFFFPSVAPIFTLLVFSVSSRGILMVFFEISISLLSSLSWWSFRGILVVFEAAEP